MGNLTIDFAGKVIKDIRPMTSQEMDEQCWHQQAMVIEFTDGTKMYPSCDPEGNGPGVLFYYHGSKDLYVIMPSSE